MFHTLGGNTCIIMGLMRWLGQELMQVLWHIWFGNFDVVILDCDHPGKTQRSQIKVVSFVDFSYKKHRPLTNLTKGAVIQKHIRFKISFEKQQRVAKLLHYYSKWNDFLENYTSLCLSLAVLCFIRFQRQIPCKEERTHRGLH